MRICNLPQARTQHHEFGDMESLYNYFAKGLFPPCAFKLAVERTNIFSTSANDIRNAFLCGLRSFSSASRTNRSAVSPVRTGILLISNAITFHFKRLIMSQNYTYSSKPPGKSKEFCNLSANYPQIISKQQPVNY